MCRPQWKSALEQYSEAARNKIRVYYSATPVIIAQTGDMADVSLSFISEDDRFRFHPLQFPMRSEAMVVQSAKPRTR
jgi:hypothetical protein